MHTNVKTKLVTNGHRESYVAHRPEEKLQTNEGVFRDICHKVHVLSVSALVTKKNCVALSPRENYTD
jgi:hypothetical protein